MRDITDRKLEELEHRHLAWHDSLTGLLNRYGLMKSLEAYCGLGALCPGVHGSGQLQAGQ